MGLRSRVSVSLTLHDDIVNEAKAAEHFDVAKLSLGGVLPDMIANGVITKSDEGHHRKKLGIKKTIQ